MPNVILTNGDGEDVTYSDVDEVELDTEDGGTATYVGKHLIQNQQQADWEQTDETAVDYIKNKPTIPKTYTHPSTHPASMITGLADIATSGAYEDLRNKPFGDIVVLPEAELVFVKDANLEIYSNNTSRWMDTIVVGETYIVTWDGEEYNCVATDLSNINSALTGLYLGNATKLFGVGWGTDTGEPFIIVGGADGRPVVQTDDPSASHTVFVCPKDNIRRIDSKYLPDDYGGSGITAADVTAMLASAGVIVPVAVEDNLLLSDSEGDIYTL